MTPEQIQKIGEQLGENFGILIRHLAEFAVLAPTKAVELAGIVQAALEPFASAGSFPVTDVAIAGGN